MARNVSELRTLLNMLVAAGAPGAAVRLDDGTEIEHAASGIADLRTGRPMRPDLRFRAGSLTKSFVAAVVLQLAAERRLSLDDPLERWLPGIEPYAARVDIRQLLGHTGGVPDHVGLLGTILHGSEHERLRTWRPRELIALIAGQPLRFAAGTAWAYSNTGYIFLGLIIEAITGASLADELDRRIFQPLALRDTSLPVDSPAIPEPMARGYGVALDARGKLAPGPLVDLTALNPSWAWAAGALISDLDDLSTFFRALLGGRLLAAPQVAEMRATVVVPPSALPVPFFDRYGLGVVEVDTPAGRLIGQFGGIVGYLNAVLCTEDGRRQLALMVNIGDVAPPSVYEAFIKAFRMLATHLSA